MFLERRQLRSLHLRLLGRQAAKDEAELLQSGLSKSALRGDWPVNSVLLSDGERVFHTYSGYARGLDQLATSYNFLDLTPYGRQEDWEDSPRGWPQKPTHG